ncbi:MAG: hypothetical protein ABII20_07220 [Candidatus Omnitrophota bacterium]|nr:hypothetical protein [Candidatus Omnitrophota bacterium]MBU2528514.1 hypothetical protein [bacterium]MBU3929892.1 hypothetical protein [bacterium]MBU4122366.1 hypothetical protein [bacterium]
MKLIEKKYAVVSVFAVAMAFMEAAIVVYLRALYYPEGFSFPLAAMPRNILLVEIMREAATIVMIASAAVLAARQFYGRMAVFFYMFAVWDIFYYVFLKALLGWPASFFEMDVLFLIPAVWAGPVLAPLICSFTMIALAALIEKGLASAENFRLSAREWGLLWAGAFIIFLSFIWDYGFLILNGAVQSQILSFAPGPYKWGLFTSGEILILISLFMIGKKKAQ